MLYNPTTFFIHYLTQLKKLLYKASNESQNLFDKRFAPDMFPLSLQANICIGFCLRTYYPLRDQKVPELKYPSVNNWEQQIFNIDFAGIQLSADRYLHMYAIPNFLFHLSMVYAILRANGMSVGKSDLDGVHQYSHNFSFKD